MDGLIIINIINLLIIFYYMENNKIFKPKKKNS